MTCNVNFVEKIKEIKSILIGLPHGKLTVAQKKGEVTLSCAIVLKDV